MAEPKIYSKNFVSSDCTFSVSHGSTYISRIYDRDNDSVYVTTGANSDATEASIEVTFKEGSNAINRTVDTCIVVNHNLKAPTIEYWDGSAWQSFATGSNLTTSTNIFTGTSVSTAKMRIRNSTTQTTNQEKSVGELIFCKLAIDVGWDIDSYDIQTRQKSNEIMLADGSMHRTVIKSTQYRSNKYEARVRIPFLTSSQINTLRLLKDTGDAFLWQPESSYKPEDTFLVNWVGPFKYRYMNPNKNAGYSIEMDLREV